MAQALVLLGRLVTLDPERLEDGALYICADELIHAVQSNGPTC